MHKITVSDLTNVAPEELDKEILKMAVLNELEAINDLEKMAEMTRNRELRATILNVIREKRMAVGQFQAHLMQMGLSPEELLKGAMNLISEEDANQ